jgi:hypothetical protein
VITFTVDDLLRLINAYVQWCAGSVDEVRPCPHCPCRFRHKHGYVRRQVAVDLCTAVVIAILRLRCPRCGKTERIWPPWLSARWTYPWPIQEVASVAYLSGWDGYRRVAGARLDYTTLWRWVNGLALASLGWVTRVAGEITRWGGSVPAVSVDRLLLAYKSRSEAKAYRLGRLVALWPLLGALASACRPWLPDLEPPGAGMLLTFWNAYRIQVLTG